MEAEFTYYEDFFHVVVDTYREIVKLEKEHNELQASLSQSEKASEDLTDKIAEKMIELGGLL